MELSQLRHFVTIAETQSFTEAAHRLHLSQPALSYQIKQLENELGARLFNRTSRKVDLSQDGKAFLPLAQSVLAKADEAQQMMKERLGVATGEVSFGTIPTVGAYAVPQMLAGFRRNFPGITVNLLEAGGPGLERGVLDRKMDFAIVSDTDAPDALDVTPLVAEELMLAVPVHHELAGTASVHLRDLEREEFIMLGGDFALATQIINACREAGFEPQVAYHTGSMESVKSFVAHDLGVAIVPKLALQTPVDERVSAVPFSEPFTRTLNLITGKDRHTTVAARTLMVHIRSTLLSDFPEVGTPVKVR